MSKALFQPVPFVEASEFLKEKPAVTRAIFDQMLPEVQALSFTITGIERADVLQRSRDAIATLPQGGDWNAIKQDLVDELLPYLPRGAAERRGELLLRMHGFQAYRVQQYRQIQETMDVFPYLMYISTRDGKVRPSHNALHGLVLPADDPFWEEHMPPWEHGCRCQVIQKDEEEARTLQAAETHKPLDQHKVLIGDEHRGVRERLSTQGQLMTGPGEIVDVRSPRQRGSGFYSLDDLRIPIEAIRDRYDADVFDQFENWATKTVIPGLRNENFTLWQWLSGEPIPPSRQPIGAKIKPRNLAPAVSSQVTETMDVVDSVHEDGPLAEIPVGEEPNPRYDGSYAKEARAITMRSENIEHYEFTFLHELGHALDHQAFGQGMKMGSEVSRELQAWREAVRNSSALQLLRQRLDDLNYPDDLKNYYTSAKELFARSYSQWVVVKSGNPELLAQLNYKRDIPVQFRNMLQWTDDDFVEIASTFDALFEKRGWLISNG